MNFIDQIKSARRVSTPLLAVTTPDAAASIFDIIQVVNGAPLISWDIVKGVVALNDAAKPLLKLISGDQDPSMMTNPTEVLAKLPTLPSMVRLASGQTKMIPQPSKKDDDAEWVGLIVFMQNLHFYIKEPSVIQGLWNLRDDFKRNRRTLITTAPQIMLPRELQDVIVIDYPLPDAAQIRTILKDTYDIVNVAEPTEQVREAETEALIGTPSVFLAEQVAAMCITKTGMNMEGLRQRKRQMVARRAAARCGPEARSKLQAR